MIKKKIYWVDRDVETLSRDELLQVIEGLMAELDTLRGTMNQIIEISQMRRLLEEKKKH